MAAYGLGVVACAPTFPPPSMYTIIDGAPSRRVEVPDVPQAEWTMSRARLARLRSVLPRRPYAQRIRVGVVDPRTGKLYEARGAVAVSPDRAARLVLLGPGGTTAFDLWVTRDRYRFSIPPMKLEKKGGVDLSDARGLPVGFLRWWFLSPLEGRLLLARSGRTEASFLFRDGPATVTVRTDGEHFVGIRKESRHLEGIEWSSHGLVQASGARGSYVDGDWGTRVDVVVEELLPDEPDPAAFLDPEEQETAL